MDVKRRGGIAPYVAAISCGVAGGFALLYWGPPNASHIQSAVERDTPGEVAAEKVRTAALQFATAVGGGDCHTAIAMTGWMQDRLEYVQSTTGDDVAVSAAREDLCRQVQTRAPEGGQLRDEGIEDQYVFVPGAAFTVDRVDAGRDDLEKPCEGRAWIRVTYPSPSRGLRDRKGLSIHTLLVGVNLSRDGQVLKAGVRGNLEIDWDSVSTDWTHQGDK